MKAFPLASATFGDPQHTPFSWGSAPNPFHHHLLEECMDISAYTFQNVLAFLSAIKNDRQNQKNTNPLITKGFVQ
jgi:hypothetical protein